MMRRQTRWERLLVSFFLVAAVWGGGEDGGKRGRRRGEGGGGRGLTVGCEFAHSRVTAALHS